MSLKRFAELLFGSWCPVCGYRVRRGVIHDGKLAHRNCALAKLIEEHYLGRRSP